MSELQKVQKGVSYVYYGLYLMVGSIFVAMVGGGTLVVLPIVGLALIAATPLMIIAGSVLSFIGRLKCLSVPDQCSATGVIYTAVVCDVIAIVISAASWFTELPPLASSLNALLTLTASILFIIFLKKIAAFIRDSVSEKRSSNVLNLGIATFVAMIIGIFFPPLIILAFVMMIVGFIIYVKLLISLKESLKTA